MERKINKKRLKEVEVVYQSLGLNSEQLKYFEALGAFARQAEQEPPIVFIESRITSDSEGEFQNAGLE